MDAPTLTDSLARETAEVMAKLGGAPELVRDGALEVRTPITGEVMAQAYQCRFREGRNCRCTARVSHLAQNSGAPARRTRPSVRGRAAGRQA